MERRPSFLTSPRSTPLTVATPRRPSIALHFSAQGWPLPPPRVPVRVAQSRDPVAMACQMVRDFAQRTLDDHTAGERLALVAHELLQNASRYASDDTADLEVDVREEGGGCLVTIQSRNRAEEEHRLALARLIAEMEAAPDPYDYYRRAVTRSAQGPGSSGLGLARIRAEAAMTMSCELEGDEARVTARGRL